MTSRGPRPNNTRAAMVERGRDKCSGLPALAALSLRCNATFGDYRRNASQLRSAMRNVIPDEQAHILASTKELESAYLGEGVFGIGC